jgi:hypothetical protein
MIKAAMTDIKPIMSLIEQAIIEMKRNGIDQWDKTYPDKKVITNDITTGSLYKITIDGKIAGVVALNEDQHPEYKSLSWNDSDGRPLIVHRLCVHPGF